MQFSCPPEWARFAARRVLPDTGGRPDAGGKGALRVARFDRYFLSQLMMLFGFFSLILVMVYWINRAVLLFDQLIADGQSALVFLEFTALTLPNVIRLVLPVSAFVAALYATNRLSTESELVVVQSTGFSNLRLARPVFVFGVIVALLISVLAHFLVPLAAGRMADRRAEIAENIAARFLSEGRFLHPAPGITFYIREITPEGELKNIFFSDARDPEMRTTYTAQRALLLRDEEGPKLLMFDGMAQSLRNPDQRLFVTEFRDFAFDIGALVDIRPRQGRKVGELSTPELLFPTPALFAETGGSAADFAAKAHERFAQPLFAIVAPLLGFAALLLGGFSRFGAWRQIFFAALAVIALKSLDNAALAAIRRDGGMWPVAYAPPLLGLALSLLLLRLGERPAFWLRLRRLLPFGRPAQP